ncbi:hypothetical protein OZD67_00590 [Wolbachia endosymbiont of Drosophila nikananu]|uniref:hypothetical protein n=1 Tax=Wolbachia TaxID=953 RepID=UPI00217559FE|nr:MULTISPECIES: hypothetical protein [Wolbachia]MDE5060653.1 hypothetical protein [Wolbachia endosymbiont of Drosophila nikananu]
MESFSGNNKDSNFIKGTRTMEIFSDNNESGSSIFQGKIREQDFSAEQKLNELKAAVEELDRQDLLRRLECERQASSCVDEIPSQAELYTKGGNEGYFDCERPLGDFWSFFESLFNLFEVDVDDPKIYQMLKEKKEKNLIAAIIKFLCDKLKKLIKEIFKSNLDLSWDKRLDKEIKELREKLNSGELSVEEFARVLERLQALTDLKFKLQMAVTGWIVTMFAEMFGVELAAIVEASKEETAKAEKTSLEAIKEVHEEVEIKIDEREKPKVPVSLFEVLYGFVRPVVLSKPGLDLLPKPMKELMPKEVIKEEIREIKETKPKVEEEKKAKPEGPKVAVCPPVPKTATETWQERKKVYGCNGDWRKMTGQGNNNTHQASSQSAQSFVSDKKASNQSAKSPVPNPGQPNGSAPEKSVQESASDRGAPKQSIKSSVADCGFDFTNMGTWNSAENESKQCSVGGAQEDPRSKVTDVLNGRAARGNGNTPSRS